MSDAKRIFYGDFGRVALLSMNKSLVTHVHSELNILIKASGEDASFNVSGQDATLTDKTAILVNVWEPHSYCYQPGASRTTILSLYIDPLWLSKVKRSLLVSSRSDFFLNPCIEIKPRHRMLADHLLSEMLSFGSVPKERIELLLTDLLLALIEDYSEWHHLTKLCTQASQKSFDARVNLATEYLSLHLAEGNAIENAAKFCGLSRAHFFMLFKEKTGMTPNIYLNNARMEKAIYWLAHSQNMNLVELSEELGFSEQGHFTRFFQRHAGAAPSQYRRVLDSFALDQKST